MLRIFILLSFYLSPVVRVSGSGELQLAIYNDAGDLLNTKYIARNVNDTLILVCKTKLDDVNESTAKLTWILPGTKNRPYNAPRPHKVLDEDGTSVRLVVENLQESDNGQYRCIDKNGGKNNPSITISLVIRATSPCGKGIFCDSHCILERYKCDGIVDCKNEKDESLKTCGPDPCQNKLKCSTGRCIPQSWCCNNSSENCTKKWEIMCCPEISRGPFQHDYKAFADPFHEPDVLFREYGDRPVNYLNNPHQYTDLNFLQTTIYAVFGCAILFMLIVTILVVAMQCKLQMRRNWQFQLLNRQRVFGNNTYHRTLNQEMDIMDMVVERYNQGNSHSREQHQQQRNAGGLLVTYNINNGVQIVGKPIEPPPYSEVAPSPPPDQGPPPPYIPRTEEGESASSSNRKSGQNERRGLSKVQASSEPTLTNI